MIDYDDVNTKNNESKTSKSKNEILLDLSPQEINELEKTFEEFCKISFELFFNKNNLDYDLK